MEACASADAGSALNAERLKYVTEHFHQLQGLTWVALGAALLFQQSVLGDLLPFPRGLTDLIFLALSLACYTALFRYAPRYYRGRFGWIEPRYGRPDYKRLRFLFKRRVFFLKLFAFFLLVFLSVLLVLRLLGRPVGHYADSIIGDFHSMIPAHPVKFSPALCWSVCLCACFRTNPQKEDLYRTYFLASGALAWAFVALYPIWHPEAMHPTLWKFLNSGWIGLSLIAWGLYNYMTLVRLMPKRIETHDAEGADYE